MRRTSAQRTPDSTRIRSIGCSSSYLPAASRSAATAGSKHQHRRNCCAASSEADASSTSRTRAATPRRPPARCQHGSHTTREGSPAASGCRAAPPLVIAATRRGGSMPRTAHGRRGSRARRCWGRESTAVMGRPGLVTSPRRPESARGGPRDGPGRRPAWDRTPTATPRCLAGGCAPTWENGKGLVSYSRTIKPKRYSGHAKRPSLGGEGNGPGCQPGVNVSGWGPTDGVLDRGDPLPGVASLSLLRSQRQSLLVAGLDVTGHRLADQVGHRHPVLRRVGTGRVEHGGGEADQQRAGVSGLGA